MGEALEGVEVADEIYESLPELNPTLAVIQQARDYVNRLGIPGLLIYNAGKAILVGTGAYIACPGEIEVKALAAGAAGIGLLSMSPTLWTAGALIIAKIGARTLKAAKASPKP